jgi:GT2 family glycosyltransferase
MSTPHPIASVEKMDYPNVSILIVDNGSQDDSVEWLRPLVREGLELLESPVNTGYTGGCNLGMRRALEMDADYVWLLNNDAIVDEGALSSIVALAETDASIGLVTPRIAALDEDRLTFAGGVISIPKTMYNETHDPAEAAEWSAKYPEAGLVIGTAMLVRVELIRKIGMLDEGFFAYFEDIDYSARSAAAGFRNVVDGNSTVRHLEKNRNTMPLEIKPHYWYYMARNESRFWRKHLGLKSSLRPAWYSFNGFLRHRNRVKDARPESEAAILAGLWDGWRNRGGAYRADARMPEPVAALVRAYSSRSALQPKVPNPARVAAS